MTMTIDDSIAPALLASADLPDAVQEDIAALVAAKRPINERANGIRMRRLDALFLGPVNR